jgi:hypothetical protein
MYDEDGTLRRRSRSPHGVTPLDPLPEEGPTDWADGKGAFYKFQTAFKKKFPGSRFEHEFCDIDTKTTECHLTGFDGSLNDLVASQTREVTFMFQDGRIVVVYKQSPPRRLLKLDPLIVAWTASLLALVSFLYFFRQKYIDILK